MKDFKVGDSVRATVGQTVIHGTVTYIIDPYIDDFQTLQIKISSINPSSNGPKSVYIHLLDGWVIENLSQNISEMLNSLKIGTRFTTDSNDEYIKLGNDSYIETDEELFIRAAKIFSPSFLGSEDFSGTTSGITIIED